MISIIILKSWSSVWAILRDVCVSYGRSCDVNW